MNAVRHPSRSIIAITCLLFALPACKHDCEQETHELPKTLVSEGLVVDGAIACGPSSADAKTGRFYHAGTVEQWASKYRVDLINAGWEPVGCKGGEIESIDASATNSQTCFVKGQHHAFVEVYPYGHHLLGVIPRDGAGVIVELDPEDPYRSP